MSQKKKCTLRVGDEIGRGAFGVVYLAETDDGEQLALKKLAQRRAFQDILDPRNELDVLRQLKHDHVIVYANDWVERDHIYILTEYCAGGDLAGFLSAAAKNGEKLIPEDLLLVWLWQMTCGLDYMHSHNPCIVHRDLKPSNVYLTHDGIIRLGDMGIARVLNHPDEKAMTFCGTKQYMSPEALTGTPYDAKTDIWALGCCIVEMATLDRAFGTTSIPLLLDIMQNSRTPLPRPYGGGLDNLVGQMLLLDPKDRIPADQILEQSVLTEKCKLQPLPLLEEYDLKRYLAWSRLSETSSTFPPTVPRTSEVQHTLTDEAITSYKEKKESRLRGREHRTQTATVVDATVKGVLYTGAESKKPKARRKNLTLTSSSVSSSAATTSSSGSSSSKMSVDASTASSRSDASATSSRRVLSSVTHSLLSSVRSTSSTASLSDVSLRSVTQGSNASREVFRELLTTVLKEILGEPLFNSAVSMMETQTSGRQDLRSHLQGTLQTDPEQVRQIESVVILVYLLSDQAQRLLNR